MQKTYEISVVVPIFNEEMNLTAFHQRVSSAMTKLQLAFQVIYVNDGSTDQSLQVIKNICSENPNQFFFIDLSRNFGHQLAISAGIENAQGNYIVIMDGDGQDPPEAIGELYKKATEGFEVVYAKRRKREGETWLKKLTAKWFYRFLQRITNINIPIDTGDFRIIHHKIQAVLKKMPEQHKYIRGQISWIGFNQTFIEYDREERIGGETKFTYRKMIRFALDGISSFSIWPLRIATIGGFLVSGISFLLILYTLWAKYFATVEPGWASTNIAILFIGGIQLIGIGILGEYLGRVSENVKQRPHYIVRDTNLKTDEN